MIRKLRSVLAGKFQQDMAWNYASLVVMGVSGILLNILIGLFYEPAHLGIFNQAFAVYIFSSQIAAAGIPSSVMKYTAEFSMNRGRCQTILLTGLQLAVGAAMVVSVLVYLARESVAAILTSPGMVSAVAWLSPGLFFFTVNKVLLNGLNGLRRMKAYAVLQALRYLLMAGGVFVLAGIGWPGDSLSVVFTVAEFILFLCCLASLFPFFIPLKLDGSRRWILRHMEFGAKSFFSNMLLELNTRVDVLMLGYFASDAVVGTYSFSAILAEGVFQILVVAIRNITPVLVQLISLKRFDELAEVVRKGKRLALISMSLVGFFLVVTYPFWIRIITNKVSYHTGWSVFAILVCGITASSGCLPFRNILLAAGYPGWHTVMFGFLVGENIVANDLFIPAWGMNGAALATAISMISLVPLLKFMTRKILGLQVLG